MVFGLTAHETLQKPAGARLMCLEQVEKGQAPYSTKAFHDIHVSYTRPEKIKP